jgi:hypothetical protein
VEKTTLLILASYVIAEFFFWPDWFVKRQAKFVYIVLHGLIHAMTSYVILQAWTCWQLPLGVLLAHCIINGIKQTTKQDGTKTFLLEQGVHVASLLMLVWFLVDKGWLGGFSGVGYRSIITFAGFIATVQGAGGLVSRVAGRLKKENNLELNGLINGGAAIGCLERALIFLLVFINQPAGIGFLVAAKSILRFEEAKKQTMAEYVLIGTLLSFSLAIAIASVTKWVVGR